MVVLCPPFVVNRANTSRSFTSSGFFNKATDAIYLVFADCIGCNVHLGAAAETQFLPPAREESTLCTPLVFGKTH